MRTGKAAARARDGHKCCLCDFDVVTAVHHIVARKDGGTNDLDNLITLCPNHHYMAHAGLICPEHMKQLVKDKARCVDPEVPLKNPVRVNFRK